ncbi:MAG: DJ-1/PfpI family protein, partial [Candidatus Sulfotelmatobacter sp.]
MPETQLPGLKIAILATDGFEEAELTQPRAALEEAGAKTILISPKDNEIQGMKHHDKSKMVDVDLTLAEADAGDYDA